MHLVESSRSNRHAKPPRILVAISLSLALGGAACGKKDKDAKNKKGNTASKAGKNTKAGKSTNADTSKAPTKAEIAAMDCDKACQTQVVDCPKKFGTKVPNPDQALKSCVRSCKTMSTVYDPAKHAVPGRRMLKYAQGKCE
jgi:hypothetical protein